MSGYELATVLEKLAGSGKLNSDDKNWVAAQLNKQHERDLELGLIKVFQSDPDMKYYIGMAGGFGIAGIMSIIQGLTPADPEATDIVGDRGLLNSLLLSSPLGLAIDWSVTGTNPIDTALGAWYSTAVLGSPIGLVASQMGEIDTIPGAIGNVIKMASAGFGGACAAILFLKAIFSGTDLGDLAQATAEAVPFS